MRERGHQRWSWAGRRVTGLSRCSVRGRCCRGWWRSSRRSGCFDPCCSAAPGLYTATGDKMEGKGGERGDKERGMFSVIIGEFRHLLKRQSHRRKNRQITGKNEEESCQ